MIAFAIAGCGSEEQNNQSQSNALAPEPETVDRAVVHVTNYPLHYFAKRIAGDRVDLTYPIPEGIDPAYWSPSPDEVAEFQNADLIFFNGATYEKWAKNATLPARKVVNTSKPFEDEWLELEDAVTHSHGPGGEHAHTGIDFNTWLDPQLAIQQAEVIKIELVKIQPKDQDTFDKNFESLKSDLQGLHKSFARATAGGGDVPLIASHPVYDYFARRYQLNLESVHWEPDTMPGQGSWDDFLRLRQEHPARTMIWEGDPDPAIADRLATIGMNGVVFHTCNNTPDEGDYLSVMKGNADRLREIFESD